MSDTRLDELLLRFHASGPEFGGWLSNHGPMAGDALLRLGGGIDTEAWAAVYERRLESLPETRWRISPTDWPEALGDPSRVGDWISFFERELVDRPWKDVLAIYWPALVTGSLASATHGLIRTGHAVRSLGDLETPPRLAELAHALGYWAARWHPFPQAGLIGSGGDESAPSSSGGPPWLPGGSGFAHRLDQTSHLEVSRPDGGIRMKLRALDSSKSWRTAAHEWLSDKPPKDVHTSLIELTDTAVSHYATHAGANPIMLVHAATAPRAATLVLPYLPTSLEATTWRWVGLASSAIVALYGRSEVPVGPEPDVLATPLDRDDLARRTLAHADEHAVKLVEVALESAERGNRDAAAACDSALRLISPLDGWHVH